MTYIIALETLVQFVLQEFYVALEGSRWHPLDNVFSEIVPKHSKSWGSV